MTKPFIYIFIVLLFVTIGLKSQSFRIGVHTGISLNWSTNISEYKIKMNEAESDEAGIVGSIWNYGGFQIGLQSVKPFNANGRWLSSVYYCRNHEAGQRIDLVDNGGNSLGYLNQLIRNNRFVMDQIFAYKTRKKPMWGGGFYVNWLYSSITRFKDPDIEMNNAYYQPVNAGVIMYFGLESEKTLWAFQFKQGITDKIRGNANIIKQFDSAFQINFSYLFNKPI